MPPKGKKGKGQKMTLGDFLDKNKVAVPRETISLPQASMSYVDFYCLFICGIFM